MSKDQLLQTSSALRCHVLNGEIFIDCCVVISAASLELGAGGGAGAVPGAGRRNDCVGQVASGGGPQYLPPPVTTQLTSLAATSDPLTPSRRWKVLLHNLAARLRST